MHPTQTQKHKLTTQLLKLECKKSQIYQQRQHGHTKHTLQSQINQERQRRK
jgi:hypothetical protein